MSYTIRLWVAGLLLLTIIGDTLAASPIKQVMVAQDERVSLSSHLVYARGAGEWQGQELVGQIEGLQWQASEDAIPNLGLMDEPVWFAVRLQVNEDQRRLLEVAQPMLDRVDIQLWRDGRRITVMQAGDMRPFSQRAIPHRNPLMPLQLEAGEDYLLLVRVETKGSLQLPLTLWEPQAFYNADQGVFALQMVFAGIMLALAVYNLLVFFMVREVTYVWYVLTVVFTGLMQLSLHGMTTQFLWPGDGISNNAILACLAALNIVGICFFSDNFLRMRRDSPRLSRCVRVFGYGSAALALFGLFGDYGIAIRLCIFIAMAVSVFLFGVGIYLWWKGNILARFYVTAWAMLLFGYFVLTLSKVGIIEHSLLSSYAPQIGAALEVLLLSFALGYRINLERRKRLAAQSEALTVQRRANEELESRVQARTRELEHANQKLREISQIDGLTRVKNRQFFEDLLRKEWRRTARDTQHLSVLMLDVDFFKAVNDNHGHQCGDACLKALGALLQEQVMRPADVVARYGGEEFVLLLPQTELEGACHVGERARQAVEACPVQCGDEVVYFTISVGVSGCYPTSDGSFEKLIGEADKALYAAKENGRNQVLCYDRLTQNCYPV